MPDRSRLILVASITFVVGIVVFFPARVAYHWFAPPDFTLAGIQGSIWQGSAGEASVAGIYLRDLNWRMRPLSLLAGKVRYAVDAKPVSGFLEGNVAVGITGTMQASDLIVSMPLQSLQQLVQVPGLSGNLSLRFAELRIENNPRENAPR